MNHEDGEKLLKVEKLNVKIGNEYIIKNLSFEVNKGEFFIILGPNGSGKTTLVKALLGLIPYKGKIIWSEKSKIGYLPERISRSKFREIPMLVKEFFKIKEKSEEKIISTLRDVGLDSKILNKSPVELSSGEFQRMFIAWALISKPNVVFFDEPNTGIDIGRKETVYSLLGKLWKKENLTIFMITHELDIVYEYATNVLCLSKRGIKCFGTPRKVLTPKTLEKIYDAEIKFYSHKHG